MPSSVAALLTLVFCGVMLWRESRKQPQFGAALWLPVAWIFFVGSKFLGQWLTLFGLYGSAQATPEDGSFIDAVFFLGLIVAGVLVLAHRKVSLSQLVRNNAWLCIFFVYAFLAITWSDFPLVAFKRWIKIAGHPVMALIILTEADRIEAMKRVLKRTAYIHIPLSVLFIKYFPEWGRGFDNWTGQAMNRGINLNKNELGYVCMVFGLFFFWHLLSSRRNENRSAAREEMMVSVAFLGLIWWLFSMAGSATAMACTILGAAAMIVLGLPVVSRRVGTYLVSGLIIVGVSEVTFGVYASVLDLLGRDVSLTDRTRLWADLFAFDINPIFGAGFESFWLGPRLDVLWSKWWWQPNQAHNGYIETYLNLGWLGVFILCCVLLATFFKGRRELQHNLDFGRFRLGLLLAILAYNYTEASFKGVHLVWTMFHLIALDYVMTRSTAASAVKTPPPARRMAPARWNPDFRGPNGGRLVRDPRLASRPLAALDRPAAFRRRNEFGPGNTR